MTRTPLHPWEVPVKVWQRLHMDFAETTDGMSRSAPAPDVALCEPAHGAEEEFAISTRIGTAQPPWCFRGGRRCEWSDGTSTGGSRRCHADGCSRVKEPGERERTVEPKATPQFVDEGTQCLIEK
ncbi:hypothetical protein TELCIR_21658 [Teladorsagia circumcincta]|uniref:Uncharacterized protein n=1 Tax=Teladorsagia circumcincta TaxID=45464 RepID=A0A2G9TG71_TELCI|nr:hypothetical protein TELCIR_21658 [Teladorsagia circumcincta]